MPTVYIRFAAHRLDALERSPLLEQLLARASAAMPIADWRADAFDAVAPGVPMPPIATAALQATPAAGNGAWVCVATPVHFRAGLTRVTLAQDGVLELTPDEARALAADFNRVFGGAGASLAVGRGAVLLLVFEAPLEVRTHDPQAAAGHDLLGFQPTGRDAPRLRRLMSEIEMWLFDHHLNRSRMARACPPVTGLWLWGGGETTAALPPMRAWTAGRDPLFAAFGSETEWPGGARAGVIVCAEQPGGAEWCDVERRWLVPAVAALRAGRLSRLDLSAAGRRVSVGRRANLRFWRRRRPWWNSFAVADDDRLPAPGHTAHATLAHSPEPPGHAGGES